MTRALALVLMTVIMGVSIFRPWVGVIACYFIAVGGILAVWGWAFAGIRVVLFIALTTYIGFALAALTGRIDFSRLRSKQNAYLLILWLSLVISYFFGPFTATATNYSFANPDVLIVNISKVFVFYFMAILVIDDKRKCQYLVWVILFNALFLIYWGNMQYFSGQLALSGKYTLQGPGSTSFVSNYVDENTFSMFFAMSIPFLYFMGRFHQNKVVRWFLWLNIPFAWHCIFLTGSRGGLVGLFVVSLVIVIRSRVKILGLALPIALLAAFVFQGGHTIKERGQNALKPGGDETVQSRFESWEAGRKMILDHPITGVGIGNFVTAYPKYAETQPFVAHNTVIQFAAESGIVAGLMYLLLCFGVLSASVNRDKSKISNVDPFLIAVQESLTGAMAGFFVCAMFLNVGTYEIFYYLLVLHAVHRRLLRDGANDDLTHIGRESAA